jgi:Ca2+-binding EF-hand superfamily protein
MIAPWMGGSGMVRMMLIMMDTDGNGAVSLQEFQAGQERVFKAMDGDRDGSITSQEVQRFGRSLKGSTE